MDKNIEQKNDKSEYLQDPHISRQIIGQLIYLNITRSDISFLVQCLNQFMNKPRQMHLEVAFKILRYFKLNILLIKLNKIEFIARKSYKLNKLKLGFLSYFEENPSLVIVY